MKTLKPQHSSKRPERPCRECVLRDQGHVLNCVMTLCAEHSTLACTARYTWRDVTLRCELYNGHLSTTHVHQSQNTCWVNEASDPPESTA